MNTCTITNHDGTTLDLSSNGVCQDGGPGSDGDICTIGTACADCGARFM
jgi:hypothetical protein